MPDIRVKILVYQHDGTVVSQYLLGEGEHSIGRNPSSAVYAESEYISHEHAKLYLTTEGIFIEDLDSSSGTLLDGISVRGKLRLSPGQRLQVGDLYIDLQMEGAGDLSPGAKIGAGRYQLVKELGRGAMGQVWLGQDTQLDEEVAIKVLNKEVANDAVSLVDLKREVQKSRKLSHDNIIRIHDLFQLPGESPFVSLEFVEGTDLHAIRLNQPDQIFRWEEVKPYLLQLCEALDYAHERKIVHRDLKPANMMVNTEGVLKLADFGIAASMADAAGRSSMADIISGTPQYMSPQQMLGEPPQASDDIYALGATMYDLLTGRPPFHTGDIAQQVHHVTPAPIEQRLAEFGLQNDVPDYINSVVMSCLAKDPTARPTSAGAIAEWIRTEGKSDNPAKRKKTKTDIERTTPEKPVQAGEETPAPIEAAQLQATDEKKSPVLAIAATFIVVAGLGWFFIGGSDQDNENKAGKKPETGTAALKAKQGWVVCLGPNSIQPPPTLGDTVIDVAAGKNHYLALRKDGTVVAWGDNTHKQCDVPENLKGVKRIYASNASSAALLSDNSLIVWGLGSGMPKSGEKFTLFTANADNSLGRYEDGSIKGWGYNYNKQLEIPENLSDVTQIEAGAHGYIALRKDGTVTAWGGMVTNVPKDLDAVQEISCFAHNAFALKQDGTVVGWGTDITQPSPADLKNVMAVAPGGYFAVALLADGTLRTWGKWDKDGTPATLPELKSRVLAIDCGLNSIVAIVDAPIPSAVDSLKEGLVAYYPFNGNAKDESGNGHDGQVNGATPTTDRHGNQNQAYDFSGNPKSSIRSGKSVKATLKTLTLSAWVYLNKQSQNQPATVINWKGLSQLLIPPMDGGKSTFGVMPDLKSWKNLQYPDGLPSNKWFMYTGIYDGKRLALYIDRKKVATTDYSAGILDGDEGPIWIGRNFEPFLPTINGKVDDIRIYNRALSADEIKALYNLEKPISKAGDASTKKPGTLLWEFETGGEGCYHPAIGVDGTVYVGSHNNKVYALNGTTGAEIWEFSTGGQVKTPPAIGANGIVYISSKDMKTYALDGKTGAKKWEFETDKGMHRGCAIGTNGTVYTITEGRAYALEGKTGARIWETGEEYGMYHTPAIGTDGTLYIGSSNNRIYAMDGATGAKKWEFVTGGVGGSPAIGADGTIYVGSRDHKLYALDGKTGAKKWEFGVGAWPSSPTIGTDGTIYIGSFDHKIYALDGKTGTEKWAFETGGRVWSPPLIGAGGTLYVGSEDRKVYALDSKTGSKQWEFNTGEGGVSSSLAIGADGTLYVGSRDGKVYALQTASKGLAKSPWPMRGQNPQRTGRASATITSNATPNSPEAKAAIEVAIRAASGKPTGILSKEDLEKVMRLELANKDIIDLTPLEGLVNLEILLLGGNQIVDLTPLANLKKLVQLDANANQISDLSPLMNLTGLKFLWLRDNPQLTMVQVLKLNHTIEQKQKKRELSPTIIVYTNSK